MENKVTT